MQTNSQKIMEAMPSFEEFLDLAEEVKKISVSKMKLENFIKSAEAETFKRVMSDESFFVNGKPVAVSYYENAYKFAGIDGSLLQYRNELAELQAQLEMKRNQFEIYKQMHDMFKVLVYQERVLV